MNTSGRIRILMRCAGAALALLLLCPAGSAEAQTRRTRTRTAEEWSEPKVKVQKMTRKDRMYSGDETHHKIRGMPLIQTQELFTLGDASGRSDQFYKQSRRLLPHLF